MRFFLSLLLLLLVSTVINAADTFEYGGITYSILSETDKTCSISKQSNEIGTEVEIPRSVEYNGESYVVTEIVYEAFRNCSQIKSLIIPSSISKIQYNSFWGCQNLQEVTFEDSETELYVSNVHYVINSSLFQDSPVKKIYIGRGFIGLNNSRPNVCYGLESLEEVKFTNSPITLSNKMFANCTSIKEITVPVYAKWQEGKAEDDIEITEGLFSGCSNLESATILTKGAYSTARNMFRECKSLKKVKLPMTIMTIAARTFSGCVALQNLPFDNLSDLMVIGERAFGGCNGLEIINLPNTISTLGRGAFQYCENLKTVILPKSLVVISIDVFHASPAISEVFFMRDQLISGDRFTFENDTYYKATLYVPSNILSQVPYYSPWGNFTKIVGCKNTKLPFIELNPSEWNTYVATTPNKTNLNYRIIPEALFDNFIQWDSSDPSVAEVLTEGNEIEVIGGNEGTANITATLNNGNFATCRVTVNKVLISSIVLNPISWDGIEEESFKIKCTVMPEDATDKSLIWSSSDPSIATVSEDGVVSALKPGEAVITATAADGSGVTASCNVYVSAKVIPVESLTIEPKEWNAVEGETLTLSATVMPEDATDKSLVWSSSDPSVATVSEYGVVSTLKPGEAVISAIAADGSGVTASCNVYVSAKLIPVESLTLNPSEWTGEEGESFQITPLLMPENASEKTLEWYSSNEIVATVDKTGMVSVLSQGSCVITAKTTDGSDLSAECIITSTTGIEDILADDMTFDVYSIQGALIDTDCTRDDLKKLSSGIYILRSGNKSSKIIIR